ncbi:MAG: PxKF domain-containing protein, partial [Pyrinomonadaceae bacterium]
MFNKIYENNFIRLFIVLIPFVLCAEYHITAQTVETVVPFPPDFNGRDFDLADSIAVNPNVNRLYAINGHLLHAYSGTPGGDQYIHVFDTANNSFIKSVHFPVYFSPFDFWGGYTYMAINPNTNRLYVFGYSSERYGYGESRIAVFDGNTDSFITTIQFPPDFKRGWCDGDPVHLTVNPSNNRVYLIGEFGDSYGGCGESSITILDGNNNSFIGAIRFPSDFRPSHYIAVNPNTNRLYVQGGNLSDEPQLAVFDGNSNSFIKTIPLPPLSFSSMVTVNPNNNRLYMLGVEEIYMLPNRMHLATIDGNTDTFIKTLPFPLYFQTFPLNIPVNPNTNRIFIFGYFWYPGAPDPESKEIAVFDDNGFLNTIRPPVLNQSNYFAVNPLTNKLYVSIYGQQAIGVIEPGSALVPSGSNVTAQADAATLTFTNITNPGTVSVAPISDPATAGDVPGGFAISETVAFQITTTATFSGNVTSCFPVPTSISEPDFNDLRIFHREFNAATNQYELIDRTSSRDFQSHKICAVTTSFSPFYLASVGKKVRPLFDRTRAFRAGSTVPVKVQMRNGSDQNISSPNLALIVRGLRRIGSSTTTSVTDAGNSNPDSAFRYDSSLGGYIYNLKTTGLASGKYALSVYAGSDRSFFYTVT